MGSYQVRIILNILKNTPEKSCSPLLSILVQLRDYSGFIKYLVYFTLRAILRMFKFDPVEFSPCPRPAGHQQNALMLKIVPDDFFEQGFLSSPHYPQHS
jgi:hypothetical protein